MKHMQSIEKTLQLNANPLQLIHRIKHQKSNKMMRQSDMLQNIKKLNETDITNLSDRVMVIKMLTGPEKKNGGLKVDVNKDIGNLQKETEMKNSIEQIKIH